MKIAVLAASGRSGQAFVHEAMAHGHSVRAGIHESNPFTVSQNLEVLECDATHVDQVTELIAGCDAVVSMIGHVKGSDEFVQSHAMEVLIQAMKETGVSRVVSLTGISVWVPGDQFRWLMLLANTLAGLCGVKRVKDGIKHVKVLEESGLEWTVLRVALLSDKPKGDYMLRAHGFTLSSTSRRTVAAAALETIEQASYVRECPVVISD